MKEREKQTKLVEFEKLFEEKISWQEILYDIISSTDPWDVNIAFLADEYARRIKKIQMLTNFVLPANVLVVGSVLLRMKADGTVFIGVDEENSPDGETDTGGIATAEGMQDNVLTEPHLELIPVRMPKRRITAEELIEAIREVVDDERYKEKRRADLKFSKKNAEITIEGGPNMDEVIEDVYKSVIRGLANASKISFSEIVAEGNKDMIMTFMSLLQLNYKRRVMLMQERLFDEIFISKYK